MRRKGSEIYAPARLNALEARCASVDPALLVATLRPFATEARVTRLEEVFAARLGSVTTLMDAPYDPHNGSAILRTHDAFGIADLHVVERPHKPFLAHAAVARGSHKWVDVHTYAGVAPALATLREGGYTLVATHPAGDLLPDDLAGIPRLCVVLGNERDGIADDLVKACDRRVRVPMRGFVESLNVSVSAAIPRLCVVLGNERDGIADELHAACAKTVRVPMRGFAESLNVSVTGAILLHAAASRRPGDLSPERRERMLARGLLRTLEHAEEILIQKGVLTAVPRSRRPLGPTERPGP